MKVSFQHSFFDINNHMTKLEGMGDSLQGLNDLIDWEIFRPILQRVYEKERKSPAGAKPFDVVLMFKVLVLQQNSNLSDRATEFYIRDRLTYMRFLGIELGGRIPDENTIWVFRERLKALGLTRLLFDRYQEELARLGFELRAGQMIDATFVEVPRQRNSRDENKRIKEGHVPEEWKNTPHKMAQKDVDARWTKKNNETHYGYKNHVNADSAEKFIQDYEVTPASTHDSQVVDPILDTTTQGEDGKKRDLYADSAYRSQEQEAALAVAGIQSQVHEKGARNKPLTEEQKASNTKKSRTRVRVEHVFAAQTQMGGIMVRTIGLARAEVKIGLMNLVYNMKRTLSVTTRNAASAARALVPDPHASSVPNLA